MNILITGVTGFVGRHLVEVLNANCVVHALVRPQTDLLHVGTKNIFVFKDSIEELIVYMKDHKINGIIHLASLYIVQHQSVQVKDLILSNIYLGTALLEAAISIKIKWFLNTGTIWQNYIPDSEEYCPVNLYAATKQAFIDMAKYYTEISELRFCTLKLCDTYGLKDSRKKLMFLFKEISETGEVLDMSPGEQEIDLIHINDVTCGFVELIELLNGVDKIKTEYVLSSGNFIRLKDLVSLYEVSTGKKLNINWGGKEYRKREVMIPWQKGNKLPNWNPSVKLNEFLESLK